MSDYFDAHTGEEISDTEAHERYDDMLDELGDVTIGGLEYPHSIALKRVDEIAYRCGFSDWQDGADIVEDGWWVRVITEDGEMYEEPKWFTDEDDAREEFDNLVEVLSDPDAEDVRGLTVQMYDTSDDITAETRITEQ